MSHDILSVHDLTKIYRGPKDVHAVDGVSFAIREGEVLGLVGESGSGKSTTGRLVLRLEDPTSGTIRFDGTPIHDISQRRMKPVRRQMQVVFQDPYAALNPRMTVGDFVGEPLIIHGIARGSEVRDRVEGLFRQVGLDPAFARRYPHEFSGGQRQRINIARAIGLKPRLIVADEPITALDVSIQAQIVNLFKELQEELGLAYLFIAHDLSMVRFLCHRVAVMLKGRIVEIAPTESLFETPSHPYTRSLLSAIPIPNPRLERTRSRIEFDRDAHSFGPEDRLVEVAPNHFAMRG